MAIGLRIRLSDGNRSARTNRKLKCNSDKSESMMAVDPRQGMERLLRLQRDAFTASRPESMATRKDRIKRAIALLKEHGSTLAKTMSADFGNRRTHQSMITDNAATVSAGKDALKHMD